MKISALLYWYWSVNSIEFNSTDHFVTDLFHNHNWSIFFIVLHSQDTINMMTFNHLNREKTSSSFILTSEILFSFLHRVLYQKAHISAAIFIIDISKLDSTRLVMKIYIFLAITCTEKQMSDLFEKKFWQNWLSAISSCINFSTLRKIFWKLNQFYISILCRRLNRLITLESVSETVSLK